MVIAVLCATGCAGCSVVTYLVVFSNPNFFQCLYIGIGGAVGSLFGMPFLMFAIMRKSLLLGTALAFAAPLIWVISARLAWGPDTLKSLWAFAVFALTCIILRFILPNVWPRYLPWVCQKCNYDLRGVTAQKCPECGRPFVGTHALPMASNPAETSTNSDSASSAPPR